AKHLNYALDFIAPANHGIEFALSCQIGQITAKCAQSWSLDLSFRRFAAFLVRFGRREIWIELSKNLVTCAFDIDFKTLEDSRGNPFAFTQKAQQNVLRTGVGMVEGLGFLAGERQHFLNARRVRNVAYYLRFRSGADLLLHFHAHGLKIETPFLLDVHCNRLPRLDASRK